MVSTFSWLDGANSTRCLRDFLLCCLMFTSAYGETSIILLFFFCLVGWMQGWSLVIRRRWSAQQSVPRNDFITHTSYRFLFFYNDFIYKMPVFWARVYPRCLLHIGRRRCCFLPAGRDWTILQKKKTTQCFPIVPFKASLSECNLASLRMTSCLELRTIRQCGDRLRNAIFIVMVGECYT